MKTYYITPDTPQELAEYIDSIDNAESISMTLNVFVKFKAQCKLGFKYNHPTYNDVPIYIISGNDNNITIIETN